jgi:hypothetical protein
VVEVNRSARSVSGSAAALSASPLDLHEGIGTLEVAAGCPRWPAELRLLSTLGVLVPGRCRATNLCDYCARLAAIETAEVLANDAMINSSPAVWSVLTTRTATFDVSRFKYARKAVTRAVRRRWPAAQCATLVEFTTGYGTGSGGDRRPHWNDMWKGIEAEDADELQAVEAAAWCERVDAEPVGQFAGQVSEFGGVMRYLALHFQKADQEPPKGWRGHRFRTSRAYLDRPMEQAREEARASLRLKRELWRAREAGLSGQAAEDAAQRALYEAGELAWELVRVGRVPSAWDADGLPSAWVESVMPVRG